MDLQGFGVVEHGLEIAPGEEIWMNYLVGISAEDKLVRSLQGCQNELKLDVRYILHFIDDYKVVCLLRVFQIAVGEDAGVIISIFFKKDQIFFEEPVDKLTLAVEINGLADT